MSLSPPRSRELWVFANRAGAEIAGFGGAELSHPQARNARAWWPTLGINVLRGHRFHRVTVTDAYYRNLYEKDQPEAQQFLTELRRRLVEPAIWIDL